MLKTTLAPVFSSPFYWREVQIDQMKDNGVTDYQREKCRIWDIFLKRVLERLAHGLDVRCERVKHELCGLSH